MDFSFFIENFWIISVILITVCLVLFVLIIIVLKRFLNIKRVKGISTEEKTKKLNLLLKPFGYEYIPEQDIVVTRIDAWQRLFGYELNFDNLAVNANMILNSYPVYFYYKGRTWLLEFWKGQYGITAGCEIGLYNTEGIISPEDFPKTHFDAASDADMQRFGITLSNGKEVYVDFKARHWWLGGFLPGIHVKPEKTQAVYEIGFNDCDMKRAFVTALRNSGYPNHKIFEKPGCAVLIHQTSENALIYTTWRRIKRIVAFGMNYMYSKLYKSLSAPFLNNGDRILFIYFSLPSLIRRIFKSINSKKVYRSYYGVHQKVK